MKYLTMDVKPQLINHTSELYPHIHDVHQNEPWVTGILLYKGNNKITELRTILQRESPNS